MEKKNNLGLSPINETFRVAAELISPKSKTGNSVPIKFRDPTTELVSNPSDNISGIDPGAIQKLEDILKLTFLSDKAEDSYVCMANSSEVRNDYRDIFDLKDLGNYSFAVLHSPANLIKYSDWSTFDFFEVPYPNNRKCFWKLAEMGKDLLRQSSSKMRPIGNNDATNEILENIAEILIT